MLEVDLEGFVSQRGGIEGTGGGKSRGFHHGGEGFGAAKECSCGYP